MNRLNDWLHDIRAGWSMYRARRVVRANAAVQRRAARITAETAALTGEGLKATPYGVYTYTDGGTDTVQPVHTPITRAGN